MAQPSFVQAKTIARKVGVGAAGGATDGAFDSPLTAGSSIYVVLALRVQDDAAVLADRVTVEATQDGESAVELALVYRKTFRYESHKSVEVWKLDNVAAAAHFVDITASGLSADSSISAVALEIADATDIETFVVNDTMIGTDTGNGEQMFVELTLPASGVFAGSDVYLIGATGATDGALSDIDWSPTAGWNLRGEHFVMTTGAQTMAVFDRAHGSNAQITAQFASANADEYGRAGIMLALVGAGAAVNQFVKITHVDSTLNGVNNVRAQVYDAPSTGHWTGASRFYAESLTWVNEDIGGGDIRSCLYIPVPSSGAGAWDAETTYAADDQTVCVVGIPGTGGAYVGDGGIKTAAVGVVVEVEA